MNEPVLKKAMTTLEFLSQDAEARRLYEDRQKFLHDEASMIEGALAEGRARGEAIGKAIGEAIGEARGEARGMAEGQRQKAREMALELLVLGVEPSIIAKASGLTEAEVLALREGN